LRYSLPNPEFTNQLHASVHSGPKYTARILASIGVMWWQACMEDEKLQGWRKRREIAVLA
jgi:hypothetical protein